MARKDWSAIDAGWYHTSSENNSYWLISGYPLFSVRWPIAPTSRVPEGIIQPYLALGPSVSYVDSSADIYIKTIDNEMNKVAFRSASIELAICLQGGLAIQLSKKVGVQAEYRYTHLISPEPDQVVQDGSAGHQWNRV